MGAWLLALTLHAAGPLPSPRGPFGYDASAPLEVRETAFERRGGVTVHEISYASPKGGRVPATLVVPGREGPFAAVIWGHWYWENSAFRKLPVYRRYREKVGPAKFDAFVTEFAWADPGRYVSRAAPASVFLQYATEEDFLTPEHVREYVALVSDPKRFVLYEAPHALNAAARRDRIAFLCEQLCVPLPPAAAIAAVPELPQPATER